MRTKTERDAARMSIEKATQAPVLLKGPRPYELRGANRRPLNYQSAHAVITACAQWRSAESELAKAVEILRLVQIALPVLRNVLKHIGLKGYQIADERIEEVGTFLAGYDKEESDAS